MAEETRTHKQCSRCKEIQPLENFHKDNCRGKNQRRSACKKCTKVDSYKHNKGRTQEYKKYLLVLRQQKYKNDPDYRQKIKDGGKRYRSENRVNYLLTRARERSKVRGLDFNLELEDIIIPEYCPLLNIKLDDCVFNGRKEQSSSSLDRIDISRGYVKGNVAVISDLANTMKNAATIEQLIIFSKNIEKYLIDNNIKQN